MEAGRREAPVKDAAGGVRFPPLSPIVFRSNCSVERGSTWFVGTLNSLSSLGTVESNEVRYFYAAARSTGCSRVFPGISADAVCIGVRVAISTEGWRGDSGRDFARAKCSSKLLFRRIRRECSLELIGMLDDAAEHDLLNVYRDWREIREFVGIVLWLLPAAPRFRELGIFARLLLHRVGDLCVYWKLEWKVCEIRANKGAWIEIFNVAESTFRASHRNFFFFFSFF